MKQSVTDRVAWIQSQKKGESGVSLSSTVLLDSAEFSFSKVEEHNPQ